MPTRRRRWIDTHIDENTATGQPDSEVLITSDEPSVKGLTLVRIIVALEVTPATYVLDSLDAQLAVMGIGIMSEETIGNGDFPEPSVADDQPVTGWMWKTCGLVQENAGIPSLHVSVDLRSQRKLMYGRPVWIVNNIAAQGAAFTINTVGIIRSLYLLP